MGRVRREELRKEEEEGEYNAEGRREKGRVKELRGKESRE